VSTLHTWCFCDCARAQGTTVVVRRTAVVCDLIYSAHCGVQTLSDSVSMGGFPENLCGARYFRGCRTGFRPELPTTANGFTALLGEPKPSFTRRRSDLASQPLGTLLCSFGRELVAYPLHCKSNTKTEYVDFIGIRTRGPENRTKHVQEVAGDE
jgi:hypothetical protein